MERGRVKEFILSEIKKEQGRIDELNREKGESESARSSWSSHQITDLEAQIGQHALSLSRYQTILQLLEHSIQSGTIGEGSIVLLSMDGEEEKYLVLSGEIGGAVGEYFIISSQSPIGKAIWGKRAGEEVKAKVPQGEILVKVLEVS